MDASNISSDWVGPKIYPPFAHTQTLPLWVWGLYLCFFFDLAPNPNSGNCSCARSRERRRRFFVEGRQMHQTYGTKMIQTGKNWTAFFSPRKKRRMPQRIAGSARTGGEFIRKYSITESPGSRPRTGTRHWYSRPFVGCINRMSQTTAGRYTREALSEGWERLGALHRHTH